MTDLTVFQQKISALLPGVELLFQELLSAHTSFRIGGAAEVMAFPKSVSELAEILKASALLDCKPAILGAGTNVLAPDDGVCGLVICLKDSLEGMELLGEDRIRVMSGVTMTRAAVFAANHGLSGLEFAHGIPGTVGGGIYMNAGAYGGEICQICTNVGVMDYEGNIREYSNEQMKFSYRRSRLEEEPGIVLYGDFQLHKCSGDEIRCRMRELMEKRSKSQPLDMPSAGSAFKRPAGGYAAALIDEAGLKGYRVGGAGVSEKHAGFVVNLGNATACDVKEILCKVSNIVYEHSGIRLEPEVRIW